MSSHAHSVFIPTLFPPHTPQVGLLWHGPLASPELSVRTATWVEASPGWRSAWDGYEAVLFKERRWRDNVLSEANHHRQTIFRCQWLL